VFSTDDVPVKGDKYLSVSDQLELWLMQVLAIKTVGF